jgi:hypothetical protein
VITPLAKELMGSEQRACGSNDFADVDAAVGWLRRQGAAAAQREYLGFSNAMYTHPRGRGPFLEIF